MLKAIAFQSVVVIPDLGYAVLCVYQPIISTILTSTAVQCDAAIATHSHLSQDKFNAYMRKLFDLLYSFSCRFYQDNH